MIFRIADLLIFVDDSGKNLFKIKGEKNDKKNCDSYVFNDDVSQLCF